MFPSKVMKFQGLYTAIVTPFAGARVDEEAFRMLVEEQVAAGVAGLWPWVLREIPHVDL